MDKETIFQKLKQNYSSLGLGDDVLQAHAESLANLNLVTDENIETVVSAQKSFLEKIQRANDKRASDAATKAKADAKKEFEDSAKKEAEEKARKEAEDAARREKEKELPDWYKTEKAATDKIIKEMAENNKALQESISAIKTENDNLKREQAIKSRKNMIDSKAKELGVPQYRIDEGFAIADDASEETITEYLTTVANNHKALNLPGNSNVFPTSTGKADKSETDAIAKSIIG